MARRNTRRPNSKGAQNKEFDKDDQQSNRGRKGKGDYMHNDIQHPQGAPMGDVKPVFNDLRWYVASEQVLNDAARIPYNIPVGQYFRRDAKFQFDTTSYPNETFVPHAFDDAIPGIMTSVIMPMLGDTSNGGDAAVNVAANSLFQFVRSKISGSRTYRPVDMMLYMGAMDSLYCYVTWLSRLYATAYTYHQANRYLSRAIIEAQNVDYDDLLANLTQFRTAINVRIAKARALYLPSVLPIFLRHSWMFSHYFIEGDSEKDQIYLHTLGGYHVFVIDSSTGAGGLSAIRLDNRSTKINVARLIQALDQMLDPIYQDEDFNRIAGDMLKAYEGNVFTLTEIPDIATVKFAYSEEVLLQFKNAKYKYVPGKSNSPWEWDNGFFDYMQNAANDPDLHQRATPAALNGYIRISSNGNAPVVIDSSSSEGAKALSSVVWQEWSKDTLLSSPHADVVAGENMINTRLTLAFDINVDPLSGVAPLMSFGSEWPVCYYLTTIHRDKSTGIVSSWELMFDRVLTFMSADPILVRSAIATQIPIRSAFKYLPEITLIEWQDNGQYSQTPGYIYESGRSTFEVDNYALVSPVAIQGMHNAAILGEYNIPNLSIGK